jgi:hypothetical protein
MDANKAMRFAQNPQLMSAMNAGLKVGSKQWDEITRKIQAAERAAKKFQMVTASGQKQYFDEVYGKVQDFISASQNLMQSTFEIATSADRSLISKLENKIKDLNAGIQDYEYALEEIAEKEEAINEEYDKKARALETVRRINEEILRQQKSQLSVAEALSRGDVSAAASAMQESRADSSRAALDGQGDLLDAAKQAQINALTAKNGLTREEIEKRIKALKKEISEIERGELAQAQSRIDAAQRKLDVELEGVKVLGRTSAQWEKIKAETDKAQAGAVLYNKELNTSIGLIKEMVTAFANVPGTVGFKASKKDDKKGGKKDDKKGGKGTKKADGGYISGPGTGTSDSIPAMLSDGEYVIKASSVGKFGKRFLDSINDGVLPGFKKGGKVSSSFKDMTQKGQEDFDRAQYVAKSQAASKANVGKKGKVFSEMFKNLIFDASSPEMAALSVLPFGLGKLAKPFKKGLQPAKPQKPVKPAPKPNRFTSFIGENLPPGMKALVDDMTMIHRSMEPKLIAKHPGEVATYQGRTQGPGTYFYRNKAESLDKGWAYGGYEYKQKHNLFSALKTAKSKGYLDFQKAIFEKQAFVQDKGWNSQVVQDLIKEGYIGMKDPATGIMTNWMVGTKGGQTLKKTNQYIGKMEGFASMFNQGSKFAKGGMVKPSYFGAGGMAKKYAKGGMVKPSYFASGGMIKPPKPEPAPPQMNKGGMVKPSYFKDGGFAKGTDTVPAMLTPGEFVINKDSAKTFSPLLSAMNNGGRSFVSPVYPEISRDYASANVGGGIYSSSSAGESNTQVDNSVYNYNLSVNVDGSNLDANDVASEVMKKLKFVQSQKLRNQVIR